MSSHPLPSRPIAGALFETWLGRRPAPLLVAPFPVKVSELLDAWTWEFEDLNPGLELCLRETLEPDWNIELFMRARRAGRVWGLPYWSSLHPGRINDRWVDLAQGHLDPDAHPLEPCTSPQALIERELFAPFALWVDEVLSNARWLLFFGGNHGSHVALHPGLTEAHRDDLVDAQPLRGAEESPAPFATLQERLKRNRLKLPRN